MKLNKVIFQFPTQICLLNIFLTSAISGAVHPKSAHVNYMLEAFNPYSVVRFFEFNDKGWNISENCLKNMYNFLEGLRSGALWAVKCEYNNCFAYLMAVILVFRHFD